MLCRTRGISSKGKEWFHQETKQWFHLTGNEDCHLAKLLYLAPHYNPKKKKKRHNTQGPLQVLEATCSLSGCATQAQYQVTWKAADFEQGPNKRTLQQIQGCCASSSATWAVWPSRCSGAGSMSGDRDTAGGFVRPLQVTHTTNLWFRSNALPFSVDNFFHFKK